MKDKLINAINHYREDYSYYEKLHPNLLKLKSIDLSQKNNFELANIFIDYYWEFMGFDSINDDPDGVCYISKPLLERIMGKSREIFFYLAKDYGKMDNEKLKEKYECIIEHFWGDLEFLLWGMKDDEGYGVHVAHWIKKGLKHDDLDNSSLNMLSWGEPKSEMLYWFYTLFE
ncbi:MAG: hypothetical protein PHG04_04640 [Candidatus Nanoarchaeia archaeon]|nr:hypothetical protein [Candidatus Nanoarchaeia archaeon]MDD5054628.1 hypothetical protein [Candidatus Nanoarchaeia archaeon]